LLRESDGCEAVEQATQQTHFLARQDHVTVAVVASGAGKFKTVEKEGVPGTWAKLSAFG